MPRAIEPRRFYNRIARVYDPIYVTRSSMRKRRLAATRLRSGPGAVILVPGCGTGSDFAHLVETIGPTGRIIGVDPSEGMLERASAKIERNGWSNVTLIHRDARDVNAALLSEW